MGLDYVDIFYHHRPDSNTPLEESMLALDLMVRQGKALYVGISSYSAEETRRAAAMLQSLGTPLLIHQPKYSMLVRDIETALLPTLADLQMGCITFSSLAQGLLTNKYLNDIPADSRARSHRGNGALDATAITPRLVAKLKALNEIAAGRQQTLAQMALSWVLRDERVTSVIIGASRPEQVTDCVTCLQNLSFAPPELQQIDAILG